eukprot:3442624-Rhodomonas_salina.1
MVPLALVQDPPPLALPRPGCAQAYFPLPREVVAPAPAPADVVAGDAVEVTLVPCRTSAAPRF